MQRVADTGDEPSVRYEHGYATCYEYVNKLQYICFEEVALNFGPWANGRSVDQWYKKQIVGSAI